MNQVSHLEAKLKEKDVPLQQTDGGNSTHLGPELPARHLPRGSTGIARIAGQSSAEASDDDGAAADSATVLEFLAWGRRKDQQFHEAPENETGPRRYSVVLEDAAIPPSLMEVITSPRLDLLEALLPSKQNVRILSEFHGESLLWYHGSYNNFNFSDELRSFYEDYQGNVRHRELNFQWLALLFAIMTGSITCASPSTAQSWGFDAAERFALSKRWYDATISCLNLANYLENHTIYSVSAIATLTISAHILGVSNTQSVLLAGAARISQSLGLHRLGEEQASQTCSDKERMRRRKRETGRRVWCQLLTQDWFSIPFSESYSLNPSFFDTAKPLNCNDSDMQTVPNTTPTITSYCNYLYDIAHLITQLQDAMASSNTLYTKYEQVLKYDEKMRALATAYMPTFLSTNAPVASTWPTYIMVHRKFLGLSFTNSAFVFTRRTCIAASKTILKEARAARDDYGPVLWIDQAFVVAAGIILSLDAFHRKPDEADFAEHQRLVSQAIDYLTQFPESKISIRGLQLLSFLTSELDAIAQTGTATSAQGSRKRQADGRPDSDRRPEKRARVFNLSAFMKAMDAGQNRLPVSTPQVNEVDGIAWETFAEMFPPQTGFGGQHLFDEFSSFDM
ncbi:C6 zinc finger [Venturia nashicola]|nr:C6 zinc finger [Venturia nashicola]